jgi:hypothetical protein
MEVTFFLSLPLPRQPLLTLPQIPILVHQPLFPHLDHLLLLGLAREHLEYYSMLINPICTCGV